MHESFKLQDIACTSEFVSFRCPVFLFVQNICRLSGLLMLSCCWATLSKNGSVCVHISIVDTSYAVACDFLCWQWLVSCIADVNYRKTMHARLHAYHCSQLISGMNVHRFARVVTDKNLATCMSKMKFRCHNNKCGTRLIKSGCRLVFYVTV